MTAVSSATSSPQIESPEAAGQEVTGQTQVQDPLATAPSANETADRTRANLDQYQGMQEAKKSTDLKTTGAVFNTVGAVCSGVAAIVAEACPIAALVLAIVALVCMIVGLVLDAAGAESEQKAQTLLQGSGNVMNQANKTVEYGKEAKGSPTAERTVETDDTARTRNAANQGTTRPGRTSLRTGGAETPAPATE